MFDIVILIPLFIIIIPALGLIYLLSLLIMGLPVIFKQQRPGLNGNPFHFYKFRTMTEEKYDVHKINKVIIENINLY